MNNSGNDISYDSDNSGTTTPAARYYTGRSRSYDFGVNVVDKGNDVYADVGSNNTVIEAGLQNLTQDVASCLFAF